MALFIVGIGLSPPGSISKEGEALIKQARKLYAELYTNSYESSIQALEQYFHRRIRVISREFLEESERLVLEASRNDIALLVSGDPLFATTHIELILRLEKAGIPVRIIQNASIVNAVLVTGLQGYKFGRVVSLPHPTTGLPKSPYDFIKKNRQIALHTLVLLDVKRAGLPAMRVKNAVELLLDMEHKFQEKVLSQKEKWVGCSRLGTANPIIRYSTPRTLKNANFGTPPHCVIIPGKLHFLEEEALQRFA